MKKRELLIRLPLPGRKRLLLGGIGAFLCVSAVAYAAIVDFNTSETLTKTKLNGNFHDLDDRSWSGTGAVRYYNGGKVGIGITTPANTLHVVGAAPELVRLQGTGTGAANATYLSFYDTAGTRTGYVGDAGSGDSAMYLASDTSDVVLSTSGRVLTATSGGSVGIGNATPFTKLDVNGHIRAGDPLSAYRGMEFWMAQSISPGTCNTACGNGYCIGGYLDDVSVTKTTCADTTLNRNCICLGRP